MILIPLYLYFKGFYKNLKFHFAFLLDTDHFRMYCRHTSTCMHFTTHGRIDKVIKKQKLFSIYPLKMKILPQQCLSLKCFRLTAGKTKLYIYLFMKFWTHLSVAINIIMNIQILLFSVLLTAKLQQVFVM